MHRWLLALLLVACTPPPSAVGVTPSEPPVPSQQTYSARGLYTYPNQLSEVPDGAFSRADEAVIRRDGIVETRRGFNTTSGTLGAAGDRFRTLTDFAGVLVGHTSAGQVAAYNGTAWSAYTGTYTAPTSNRMRFLQMAKSLYFTTDEGVKRLDALDGTPMAAGVPQALGGTVALVSPAGAGWFPADSQTAYRLVWGYRTVNNRVILGAPSGRMPLTNPSGGSTKDVTVTAPVPSWVTEDYFLQVHRADTSATAAIPAADDMALVYEVYPTAAEIAAGLMTFTDITPDELKGAPLYSSPNTGTPGSEKFQPPVCADLTEYKGRMWCASTTQRQRISLTLLSVDATSGGMGLGNGFVFGGEAYRARASEDPAFLEFKLYTSGTASENIANTAQSLVRIVNEASALFNAYYISGEYDNPGQFIIEAKELGDPAFTTFAIGTGKWVAPALRGQFTSNSIARVGTTVTVGTTEAHGLVAGEPVELVVSPSPSNFPVGIKTVVTTPTTTSFTYTEAGAATSSVGAGTWRNAAPLLTSDPENAPNGLAYSEFGEPDAVPLANYLTVGSANYAVTRVVALGATLFIFKEGEGVFVLTGDTPETFNVEKFPTPAKLLAPDSVVILGNNIYGLTDQGVMAFSEDGARIVSRPIEGTLRNLYAGGSALTTNVGVQAFGVSYETEREYWLFMPQSSVDTYAQQAFVFNYATQAWTRWAFPAHSGYVLPGADVAYLGRYDTNAVRVERKTLTAADYQDSAGIAINLNVDWVVRTGGDPSAYKNWQKVTVMAERPTLTNTFLLLTTEIWAAAGNDPISGILPFEGLPYVQTYIPEDVQRSQTLTVGVSAGESGIRYAITGLSVDYTASGTSLR